MRHYNPGFVYFLPTFCSSFMYCDIWSYVRLVFKSGLYLVELIRYYVSIAIIKICVYLSPQVKAWLRCGAVFLTMLRWSMLWIWSWVRVMKSTLRLEGAIKKIGNFRSNFLLWEMYKQKYLGEIDMIIHFPRGRSLTTYTCWSWIWSSVCVMKSMLRLEGSIEEFGSFEATFFCRHKS